ncbi:MAG TPA: GntR family transcriptional regulator [Microvirga sp.]|nr:GntR family transcriptional regulator [Microvirga sp.]
MDPVPLDPASLDGAGRKGRLHGAAVALLRERIVSGAVLPGAFLREKELCEELGISRTPLREAIRTLASEGLVRLAPNRGAVVSALDFSEVEALYQAVGQVEAGAAKLACRVGSDAEIAEIRVIHHQMMILYVRRDLPEYLALNQRIHRGIVTASHNPVLLELWELLAPRVRRARGLANHDPARWDAAVREHEEMLAALTARDGARLSALMEPHYLNGLTVIKAAAERAG